MNEETKEIGTIDLAPSWQGILPALLAGLELGSDEGKRLAMQQLEKMAQAADAYNALVKLKGEEP